MEVLYVDVLIRRRFPLTPEQQTFLRRHFCKAVQVFNYMSQALNMLSDRFVSVSPKLSKNSTRYLLDILGSGV